MPIKLHYETGTPLLRKVLNDIKANPIFEPFYSVGGTSLSLRLGKWKNIGDLSIQHTEMAITLIQRIQRPIYIVR